MELFAIFREIWAMKVKCMIGGLLVSRIENGLLGNFGCGF
jgi:hypothetical protein